MSSESRIWENRPFGSMRGGRVLVIGGHASQPSLSCLLHQMQKHFALKMASALSCYFRLNAGI